MEINEQFWKEWADVGRELLSYGQEIQFGSSLVEVKFQRGQPFVIIRSKSVKKKYPDNLQANEAVKEVLKQSESSSFSGARTFTIAYHNGNVQQVLLDEYQNLVVK